MTFASGSTFEVEVNDSDNADKVNVSGTANLDGTIRGVALERIRDSFAAKVIDAGALNGEFATIAGNKLFLEFSVDYDVDAGMLS